MIYTMANAKRERAFKGIKTWAAERTEEGWLLQLDGLPGPGHLVDAREGKARIFKTLDAALKAAEAIGFRVNLVCGEDYVQRARERALIDDQEERAEEGWRKAGQPSDWGE